MSVGWIVSNAVAEMSWWAVGGGPSAFGKPSPILPRDEDTTAGPVIEHRPARIIAVR